MSATEDQARTGAMLDAEEDAASRTFAHEPGESACWSGSRPYVMLTR
jgi:hypothetical protein